MIRFATIPVLAAVAVLPAIGQEQRSSLSATYKVEFRIRDGSDASAKNGRRYAIWIDSKGRGSFQLSERVPVPSNFQPGNPPQFTYYDTDVNIDTNIYENESKVGLNATLNMSTLPHKADGSVPSNPEISHIKVSINAEVLPNKPSLVASIDDPVEPRKFDVEVLVTKVD